MKQEYVGKVPSNSECIVSITTNGVSNTTLNVCVCMRFHLAASLIQNGVYSDSETCLQMQG